MKLVFPIIALLLASSFYAYAEDQHIVGEDIFDEVFAAKTIGTANMFTAVEAADSDESCSCICTAQGILLRECGDETENLGNFGNIQNCNLQREKHPQCN